MSDVLPLTPDELLTTTRTVRKRLDLARPVERSVVEECLQLGVQAPNGSNRQQWTWVFVDDPATRAEMARIYRESRDHFNELQDSGSVPSRRNPSMAAAVAHLADHMHEVPVLLVPTMHGRLEQANSFAQASGWGSLLPAVWNFMLALRSRGLGSAWTTLHLWREREMAELLGIPYEQATQGGLFPVAYTVGTDFRRGDRKTSEGAIRWNHW